MKKSSILVLAGSFAMNLAFGQRDLLDKSFMNPSVKPGENFYEYAIGNWNKNNPVPASESRWSSFNVVFENNKKIIRQILDDATKANAPKGTPRQQVGDYYLSGMDSVKLNSEGIKPIKHYLSKIDGIKDQKSLMKVMESFFTEGMSFIYGIFVDQDQRISSRMMAYFNQGGLSLPDRDYYLKNDPDKVKIREEFKKYVITMLEKSGEKAENAAKHADEILAFETKIARFSMDRVSQRDPYKVYNVYALKDLVKLCPSIDWEEHTKAIGMPAVDSVVVRQPEFFKGLSVLIQETPINTWKAWMRYQLIDEASKYMTDELFNEHFNFHDKTLSGTKQMKPRWERVMLSVNSLAGELVGQLYVEKAFKPEAKDRMKKLVSNLQAVFAERINKLDWMTPETKKRALEKLNKFMVKIGYPDTWRDFSRLKIGKTYFENVVNSYEFEFKYNMDKLSKPVDRTIWQMTPQTVNAYYNPSLNEIVFPAGILQPPFFNIDADDALVYGAIGAVIGHEMTHGFDDEGRQYDGDGNLKEWWTADDAKQFEAKAGKIVDQFNNFRVLDTIPVNGKLTLGENLADLGGLNIAYDAFKRTEQGRSNQVIGDMTADQRFFWSWANAWKGNMTPQRAKQMVMVDPHSPQKYRCNGPVQHIDAFLKAFEIKEGDKMYRKPEDRVKIW